MTNDRRLDLELMKNSRMCPKLKILQDPKYKKHVRKHREICPFCEEGDENSWKHVKKCMIICIQAILKDPQKK